MALSFRSLSCAFAALATLSGCAVHPPIKPFFSQVAVMDRQNSLEKPAPAERSDDWLEEHAGGAPSIVVRLGEQRAYFYRAHHVVASTRISTGKKGYGTPTGHYRVLQKDRHHVSTLYGDYVNRSGEVVRSSVSSRQHSAPRGSSFRGARMPYFLRFSGGHGLHAGRVPDHPASHGCVRLPSQMARYFYEHAEVGTPVRIER